MALRGQFLDLSNQVLAKFEFEAEQFTARSLRRLIDSRSKSLVTLSHAPIAAAFCEREAPNVREFEGSRLELRTVLGGPSKCLTAIINMFERSRRHWPLEDANCSTRRYRGPLALRRRPTRPL